MVSVLYPGPQKACSMRGRAVSASLRVDQGGCPEGGASVVRHGLHPDALERCPGGDLVVGHAVEGHPAGQAKVDDRLPAAGVDAVVEPLGQVDHDVLGDHLERQPPPRRPRNGPPP